MLDHANVGREMHTSAPVKGEGFLCHRQSANSHSTEIIVVDRSEKK